MCLAVDFVNVFGIVCKNDKKEGEGQGVGGRGRWRDEKRLNTQNQKKKNGRKKWGCDLHEMAKC